MSEVKEAPEKFYEFKGNGYIMFYRFDEEFVRLGTFLPETLKNNFCGGLGAVLYMHYSKSEIGPYEELLFIPGKFCYRGQKNHFISKAYVSTDEAVKFRQDNWSIPTEKATFSNEFLANRFENVTTYVNGEDVASFELRTGRIRFRVGTSRFFSFSLMQLHGDEPVKLNYSGAITAKFAGLESIKVRPAFFPDVAGFTPLTIFKLKNFTFRLSKATVL
jgi:hypothetical protein